MDVPKPQKYKYSQTKTNEQKSSTLKEISIMTNPYTNKEVLRKPFPTDLVSYKQQIIPEKPISTFGYGAMNKFSKLLPVEFDRRAPRPNDIVFEIKFCGVCHSDWHTILDEWKNSKYPVITGHEMTGICIQTGAYVTRFKVGDRVALSPLYNCCRVCNNCKAGYEQYCENDTTETYNMYDRNIGDILPVGPVTYGGYSNIMVADEHFVFRLPDNLPMDKSAPLLCAGMTVYGAIQTCGIRQGHKLGIAGIGGLGHLLIKIAKTLGIYVVCLTTSDWKIEDSKRLGADHAVCMNDREQLSKIEGTLDYIIDTIPFKHDLDPYLDLLKIFGTHCVVGSFYSLNPDFNKVIRKGKVIRGSNINSLKGTTDFLSFCSVAKENGFDILPDIELITLDQINKTHDRLVRSRARYRYVIDVQKSMSLS